MNCSESPSPCSCSSARTFPASDSPCHSGTVVYGVPSELLGGARKISQAVLAARRSEHRNFAVGSHLERRFVSRQRIGKTLDRIHRAGLAQEIVQHCCPQYWND